jgi:hypothetical protein
VPEQPRCVQTSSVGRAHDDRAGFRVEAAGLEATPGSVTAPWGRTHRTHFTAPLEIRVRNAIGGCPDLGQFGSALRDNYDLYHMLA